MFSVSFNPSVRFDIAEIARIEFESFDMCPRVEDEIDYWYRVENVRVIGAYIDGKIVGYVVYSIHPDSLHLERVAVTKSLKRTGIGRQLVGLVAQECNPIRSFVDSYVPVDQIDACKFMSACGYIAVQSCDGVLDGPCTDAYRFELRVYK